jgi:hypothetical protein
VCADLKLAFSLAVFYTASPFLLTLMHSWASFTTMVTSFPAYFPFLPTMLADLFAYSLARLDDWRWGTKSAATVGVSAESVLDSKAQRDARSRLAATTTAVFGVQLVGCAALAIVNVLLRNDIRNYLLALGGVTAGIGLCVVTASFTYFFARALGQLVCCRPDLAPRHQVRRSRSPTIVLCAAVLETALKLVIFAVWVAGLLAQLSALFNVNGCDGGGGWFALACPCALAWRGLSSIRRQHVVPIACRGQRGPSRWHPGFAGSIASP